VQLDLIALGAVKHNGKWFSNGEPIKKVKKEDGERLIELGIARVDEELVHRQKAEEEAKKKAEEQAKKEVEEKAKAEAESKKKAEEDAKKEIGNK
jgi:membrane protein involved in colicin uptake